MSIVRRLWAIAALASLAAAAGLAVALAVGAFPRGLLVLACLVLAVFAAWRALLAGGAARGMWAALAVVALAAAVAIVFLEGQPLGNALVIVLFALSIPAAREAFRVRVHLPAAAPPRRPVLFYNPKSGGGKAERFRLADEAAARGIEAIELTLGTDLRELVMGAVEEGADALAMAGGDGSQAIVAAIAAEHDLPYACIPAGTRNHFALDLGVDREDVVGALDAFAPGGGERRVDLATINGRVFVNNVSLGIYAEAVQREEYRGAKMRTIAATAADSLAGERPPELHWQGARGAESGTVILVSNNVYRLGRALGSGARPRLDSGRLGIAVLGSSELLEGEGDAPGARKGRVRLAATRSWSAPRFEVNAATPVPAGIDGEAAVLEPPLSFRILPGALRVRIAPEHPGASPAAALPEGPLGLLGALGGIAFGPSHAGAPGRGAGERRELAEPS